MSQLFTGWGRSTRSVATEVSVGVDDSLPPRKPNSSLIPRGAGCSYNDAAQCGGGQVLDYQSNHIVISDGVIEASASLTIQNLLQELVPAGWFVPVTPGTALATLGGCVAADVHGKNHHIDGSWGGWINSIELVVADGSRMTVSREVESDIFWATIGGMGLTGLITRVSFDAIPIQSAQIAVDTIRTMNLDDTISQLETSSIDSRYTVAWLDTTCTGSNFGRGVVGAGNHSQDGKLSYEAPRRVGVPKMLERFPAMVNRYSIRAFNEAWYLKAPKKELAKPESITAFFHPLDGVSAWNRLYGKKGFVQYQSVVPDPSQIETQLRMLQDGGAFSALTVLKQFGPGNEGHLSFPTPGWTLALDIPVATPDLAKTLNEIDEFVLGAGGRVYLAKDGRASRATVAKMYPRLSEWQQVVNEIDPERVFSSDLDKRLKLRG